MTGTADLPEGLGQLLAAKAVTGFVVDCDGTLIDSMPLHWRAYELSCAEFGLEYTRRRFYEMAGMPTLTIFELLVKEAAEQKPPLRGATADPAECAAFKTGQYRAMVPTVKTIGCMVRAVEAAHAHGIPLAIASGSLRANVEMALHGTGLAKYFTVLVCAEDVKNGKPSPDCFLLAAEKLGVAASGCVGFEDGEMGMAAIRAAGYLKACDVRDWDGYPRATF